MSESWEREDHLVKDLLKLENYDIVSNVHQRKGRGGRPLIIVDNEKYIVEDLTNKVVDIPWGVEVVWAAISPRTVTINSIIKKIIVACIYFPPKSRNSSDYLDHIVETYNFLSTKYSNNVHWILAGDTNHLKLDQILFVDPNFRQVVESPTRIGSDDILDPIITNLAKFYNVPECLRPLESDVDVNGKPSDHLMIVMNPITKFNNRIERKKKIVKIRPKPDSKLSLFENWIKQFNWRDLYSLETAHEKAEFFQNTLESKFDEFFPLKSIKFCNDDQPFFTSQLKILDRKRKNEYKKHRKSAKYHRLNKQFKKKCRMAKQKFYKNMIGI